MISAGLQPDAQPTNRRIRGKGYKPRVRQHAQGQIQQKQRQNVNLSHPQRWSLKLPSRSPPAPHSPVSPPLRVSCCRSFRTLSPISLSVVPDPFRLHELPVFKWELPRQRSAQTRYRSYSENDTPHTRTSRNCVQHVLTSFPLFWLKYTTTTLSIWYSGQGRFDNFPSDGSIPASARGKQDHRRQPGSLATSSGMPSGSKVETAKHLLPR